ncbi:MAG: N-formylglutamate amidohydrolase, partial [Myxococcota bacterium]
MLKLVVTCEHAAHEVPDGLELGIPPEVVTSHVGWDPGAHEVAEAVARRWSVPLLAGRYSRLVADLNRGPNNPEVVPEVAFGVPVPGNRNLGTKGRETRVRDYHTPYWRAARDAVDSALEIGPV